MPRYLCMHIFFKYSSVKTYGKRVSSSSFNISFNAFSIFSNANNVKFQANLFSEKNPHPFLL